ncbi:MAG: replication initiator protein [Microvirus sp.]|nr:MAG: replication initiator protein [Microvirus sp.]
MSCFNPISATLGKEKPNGKKTVVFLGAKDQRQDNYIKLPCGKCIGCLRNRAREWGIRCVHESINHQQNSFLTLTYSPEHLPPDGSIHVEHIQKFIKRLRKEAKLPLRYFLCGEYGSKLLRPHYHLLVFGYDFPDKLLHQTNGLGQKIYRSPTLERLWPFGFSTIGAVTNESAQYVARYTLKKVYGTNKKEHYGNRKPEFVTMSRRPGIGFNWYQKNKNDVYPAGSLLFNQVQQMPPRYYDALYQKDDPDSLENIKMVRVQKAKKVKAYDNINGQSIRVSNSDSFRLPIREKIVIHRMRLLKRFMEEN